MISKLKRLYKISRIKQKRNDIRFLRGANISIRTDFEGQNTIGSMSWFDGFMGYGTYIGDNCTIDAKIGKYCSIGHNVNVLTGTHPSHVFVSTSPVFYSLRKQNGTTYVTMQKFKETLFADEEDKYGVVIENDVWIGFGVTIMGGVKIGDGAIIAAGSFVNSDVSPYTIVAGQPAKKIGQRFSNEKIEFLLNFRWWDKQLEWIKEHADDFDNVESLLKYENN